MFEWEATHEPLNDAKQYFKINILISIFDTTVLSIVELFVQKMYTTKILSSFMT